MSNLLGRFLLLNVFPAFLPQAGGDDEVDYYESLGVARSSSGEDIRKAYKKRSLQLHPDKILQRGGQVTDEVREEYQRVQEAYAVLNDPKKRSMYHSVGCSSVRYQFMSSGEMYNPAKLYTNLAAATTAQKSRIVFAICVLEALILLTPILVCVKINHSLADDGGALQDADWTLLLIPLWVLQGLYVLIWFLLAVISPENKCQLLLVGTEQFLWLIGELLISLRWDRILDGDYAILFLPIYLALAVRWMGLLLTVFSIRRDIRRMVTLEYLESKVLDGRSYEDLSQEEREEITKAYLIVHVPPHVKELLEGDIDPEDEVALSPEYEAAMELHNQAVAQLWRGVVFAIPTVVMLVLKIDGVLDDDVSWWLVFVPVWVYLGAQILYSLYLCCCGTVFGDQIVVVGNDDGDENDDKEEEGGGDAETPAADRRSSAGFAAAEGEMDADLSNKSKNEAASAAPNVSEAKEEEPKDEPLSHEDRIRELNKARVEAANKTAAASTPTTADTTATTTPNNPSSQPSDSNNDVEQGDVEEEDDGEPYMDAETFEQWQSAYQEAQESAMEAQTKAQANLCGLSFQLIMACLIVGKLEAALGGTPDEEEDSDVGYSAMWILFPLFFISGCILCCCACMIYGAQGLDGFVNQEGDEDEHDDRADGNNNNNTSTNNEEESPIVMMPPPPPATPVETTTTEPDESAAKEEEKAAESKLPEPTFDGDELD